MDRWSSRTLDLAQADDAEGFLRLMDAYANDPAGGGGPLRPEVRAKLVTELVARPHVVSIGGFLDDALVALANCVEGFSTFAAAPLLNIHDFVVLPEARGRGLSQRLLLDIETLARARGACKITLEVLAGNDRAQRAYAKFGFAPYRLDPTLGPAEFWQKPLTR